ncbi:MAG: DUF892 family protein, partial [Chloroflexi bacterium]|nr:DUF892 family protein [Chloroflexota bacterium]
DEFKSGAKEIKQPDLLNGFIVAGGMKGEHYEIATYRCLVAKAELIGHTEAMQLLQQNLEMEEKFSQQLEVLDRQLGEELIAKGPELVGHEVSQFKPAQGARSGTSAGR